MADRDAIINAFHAAGYVMAGEVPGESMTFRAGSFLRRLWLTFDDRVTVRTFGAASLLKRIRKGGGTRPVQDKHIHTEQELWEKGLNTGCVLAGAVVLAVATAAVPPPDGFRMGRNMEVLVNMLRDISLFYVDDVDPDELLSMRPPA